MGKYPKKKGASKEQNDWIAYAFERCGLECVLTWEAESGWRYEAKNTSNKNGTYDISLCQLNSQYHGKFIRSQDFKNPYNVLNYCIDVWKKAKDSGRLCTTFYAYNVINKRPGVRDRFTFQ